jgi:acyl-coenzyme A synthetase/AMP-(fatty) acid ligase
VHPDVVQKCLEQHANVLEAAVIGLPDSRLGHVPVAAVEPRYGHEPPSIEELTELCRSQLTPYERPAEIKVVEALPRTPSMKVSRVDLLALFGSSGVGSSSVGSSGVGSSGVGSSGVGSSGVGSSGVGSSSVADRTA